MERRQFLIAGAFTAVGALGTRCQARQTVWDMPNFYLWLMVVYASVVAGTVVSHIMVPDDVHGMVRDMSASGAEQFQNLT